MYFCYHYYYIINISKHLEHFSKSHLLGRNYLFFDDPPPLKTRIFFNDRILIFHDTDWIGCRDLRIGIDI